MSRALTVEVRYAKNRHLRGRPPIILQAQATKDPVTPRHEASSETAQTSGSRNPARGRSRAIPSYENFLAFPL